MVEITENMSAMEVRLILKDAGWDSHDQLSKTGWISGYGYSIWFERWDWHGIKAGKVCIHAHTNDLREINKITFDTAIRALKAWDEFTDAVPHQMADDSLKPDCIQTEFFQEAVGRGKVDKEELKILYGKLMERKE